MRWRYLFLVLDLFLVLSVPVVLALFTFQLPYGGPYAESTQSILIIRLHQMLYLVKVIVIIDRWLVHVILLRVVASILMTIILGMEEDGSLLVDLVRG